MSRASDHHRPCACGAELADECARCMASNPLGSMRIEPAIGSAPAVKCWRSECRTGCFYPSACDRHALGLNADGAS